LDTNKQVNLNLTNRGIRNKTIIIMMKKLAIPTHEGMVDDHFGHCAYYTVVSLDEQNQVMNQERLDSPEGCGCKSNIATVRQEMEGDLC
jgi:predicted Fe-Mo cluster-binding NifX family protein